MKPEQEAFKLVNDMCLPHLSFIDAKKCALVCVNEIMKEVPMYTGELNPRWKYWSDVKEEIQKL